MKRNYIIQSILLTIIIPIEALLFHVTFVYISALVLGFLPFLKIKTSSKKDMLKTNLWSSLFPIIVLIVLFLILKVTGVNVIPQLMGYSGFLSLFNFANMLPNGFLFIALFNIPILIYYFFGKRDAQIIPNSNIPETMPTN